MAKGIVNPTFTLRIDKPPKSGTYPIYGRIRIGKYKSEFDTGYRLEPNRWTGKGPKNNPELSARLNEIHGDLVKLHTSYLKKGEHIDVKQLKTAYLSIFNKKTHPLVPYFDAFIGKQRAEKMLQEATLNHYRVTRNHVERWLMYAKLPKDFPIEQLNQDHIEAFREYLINVDGLSFKWVKLSTETARKTLIRLRRCTDYAISRNLIVTNPFRNMKLGKKEGRKGEVVYLTEQELDALYKLDLGGHNMLSLCRDMFIFQAYTTFRVSDFYRLCADNVIFDPKKDRYTLRLLTKKEKVPVDILLAPRALEVYHRYEHEREVTGKLMPFPAEQTYRKHLKKLATMAGIKKHLSTHAARHTGGMFYARRGVPVEHIQRIMGHEDIKTTLMYVKLTEQIVHDRMAEINWDE